MRALSIEAWVVFALVAQLACGPSAPRLPQGRAELEQEDTTLGPGDVFDVRVYREEDLSAQYRVESDGTIDFPLIGRIRVAGLEPSAVAEEIAKRLREGQFLVNPHVSVRVQEYNSRRISILGAVRQPGSYPIRSRMGVVEAISLAGGFTALANRDGTRLTRRINGELRTFNVPVDRIASGQEPDIVVRAGDILHVPERLF
ncbi:MAG: polysaccharide export protein [Sandaracinaceae bacterium]|nr:polysaccharide export protein [Sandaracinaceae bacterium]